jgi:hypothetical protein
MDILELFDIVPAPIIKKLSVASKYGNITMYPYQKQPVIDAINILMKSGVVLNLSDTGVGKTYISGAICRELNLRPIIVCPKTLIYTWKTVMDSMGVEYYDIVNYETLRLGRCYQDDNWTIRCESPWVIYDENSDTPYQWKLPNNAILIFDESHRCKNPKSTNGKLLCSALSVVKNGSYIMLLSATMCESLKDTAVPLHLLGVTDLTNHHKFIRGLTSSKSIDIINTHIYEILKPYSIRITIKQLGNKFPKNNVYAEQYITPKVDTINKSYRNIRKLIHNYQQTGNKNVLGKIQKYRQIIELLKVPIFIEQAKLFIENNKSVVIFVNYLKTIEELNNNLNCVVVHGSLSVAERQHNIEQFQSDAVRIIVLQVNAGGVGISLHDLNGNHPRMVLISCPDSAVALKQALGRTVRSGALTHVIQKLVFAANVDYEKTIARNINQKLANISMINDGDLEPAFVSS